MKLKYLLPVLTLSILFSACIEKDLGTDRGEPTNDAQISEIGGSAGAATSGMAPGTTRPGPPRYEEYNMGKDSLSYATIYEGIVAEYPNSTREGEMLQWCDDGKMSVGSVKARHTFEKEGTKHALVVVRHEKTDGECGAASVNMNEDARANTDVFLMTWTDGQWAITDVARKVNMGNGESDDMKPILEKFGPGHFCYFIPATMQDGDMIHSTMTIVGNYDGKVSTLGSFKQGIRSISGKGMNRNAAYSMSDGDGLEFRDLTLRVYDEKTGQSVAEAAFEVPLLNGKYEAPENYYAELIGEN